MCAAWNAGSGTAFASRLWLHRGDPFAKMESIGTPFAGSIGLCSQELLVRWLVPSYKGISTCWRPCGRRQRPGDLGSALGRARGAQGSPGSKGVPGEWTARRRMTLDSHAQHFPRTDNDTNRFSSHGVALDPGRSSQRPGRPLRLFRCPNESAVLRACIRPLLAHAPSPSTLPLSAGSGLARA